MSIKPEDLKKFVESEFTSKALPSLQEFIKIANISPAYDPEWKTNKLLLNAASHLKQYAEKASGIEGLTAILSSDENATPLLLITVEATAKDGKTVLFYGHFDKQPGGDGWKEGYGPYTPVLEGDYLYGRGSADDGYAFYSIMTMIRALENFKIAHPKFVIMLEGSEESGSVDLPFYLEEYQQYIGKPNLVITMDSGAGDYERIWFSSSLRGIVSFDLTVSTLTKGIHSGKGSGVAPESFMILRNLLRRLEDCSDKKISIKSFEVDVPESVRVAAEKTVNILGDAWFNRFPLLPNVKLLGDSNSLDLYLNNTWRPSLAVLGANGIPLIKEGGNVLRPFSTVRVSIRTPPTFDSVRNGQKTIEALLKSNAPFGSTVLTDRFSVVNGVQLKDPSDKLRSELNSVSKNYLSGEMAQIGLGGSIPFTSIFSKYFPDAQIIVTGAAGSDSRIHGPMEKLNVTYTKNFICTFTHFISNYTNYI